MTLYHDIPASRGVENALKRARQMTDFRWTPVKPMSVGWYRYNADGTGQRQNDFTPAWLPRTGLNYSSVRIHETFVGFAVSFETFASAVVNPHSVLYTKPQHELGEGMYAYYGTVCSAFASYVFDMPFPMPVRYWPIRPGVRPVDSTELENLQLCDMLVGPDHIAVITDIRRDENGKVRFVTVSEAVRPFCTVTAFTPAEFRKCWLEAQYKVYRYEKIDEVTYTPSPFIPLEGEPEPEESLINTSLLPDFGNKANYEPGETVELDVLEPNWNEVVISGADDLHLPITDGKAVFDPVKPGFYTAYCIDGGEQSRSVEFCVTAAELQFDKAVYENGEPVTMRFTVTSEGDEPLGWVVKNGTHNLRQRGEFTAEDKAAGEVVLPALEPGDYFMFSVIRNRFGTYKSKTASLRIL